MEQSLDGPLTIIFGGVKFSETDALYSETTLRLFSQKLARNLIFPIHILMPVTYVERARLVTTAHLQDTLLADLQKLIDEISAAIIPNEREWMDFYDHYQNDVYTPMVEELIATPLEIVLEIDPHVTPPKTDKLWDYVAPKSLPGSRNPMRVMSVTPD